MEITRRPALAADMDLARRIHHDAYRETVERQFGPWDEAAQDRFFQASWAAAAHEMVEYDSQPCGYVCIEERTNDIHVREIAIAPVFQGQGIGSALLREVLARAHARHVPVRLGTFHTNRAANLYRRLGFREIGHTASHILLEWRGDQPAALEEAT